VGKLRRRRSNPTVREESSDEGGAIPPLKGISALGLVSFQAKSFKLTVKYETTLQKNNPFHGSGGNTAGNYRRVVFNPFRVGYKFQKSATGYTCG